MQFCHNQFIPPFEHLIILFPIPNKFIIQQSKILLYTKICKNKNRVTYNFSMISMKRWIRGIRPILRRRRKMRCIFSIRGIRKRCFITVSNRKIISKINLLIKKKYHNSHRDKNLSHKILNSKIKSIN